MRFATVAVMAGSAAAADYALPSADTTAYVTQVQTVTACPESVTNCPASSMTTSVTSSVIAMTTSTVYETQYHTVTSCAPTVTNCPAHSTIVSTEVVAVSTTVCPVASASSVPIYSNNTMAAPVGPCGGKPCPPASSPAAPATTAAALPTGPAAPVCPGSTVTAITKSYTTVLTSVEYSTIQVPCPTQAQAVPTGVAPPAVYPPATGSNQTVPAPGPVTAGASSFAGSALLAAAAGVAAYVFA